MNSLQYPKWLDNYESGYGYAYSSGWLGIGGYYYDSKTYLVVWFNNDEAISSEDEIIYCDFMKMNILEFMGELNEQDKKQNTQSDRTPARGSEEVQEPGEAASETSKGIKK